MKKINDSFIYFYILIVSFTLGIILGLIFAYSRFFVEPEITQLISVTDDVNISENYKKAYLKLKNPQIFARYENFDNAGKRIKNLLEYYDKKIEKNEYFDNNDRQYLEILLERRVLGSMLTKNTMIFFFLLSVLGLILYIYERKQNKNA